MFILRLPCTHGVTCSRAELSELFADIDQGRAARLHASCAGGLGWVIVPKKELDCVDPISYFRFSCRMKNPSPAQAVAAAECCYTQTSRAVFHLLNIKGLSLVEADSICWCSDKTFLRNHHDSDPQPQNYGSDDGPRNDIHLKIY
jgi:hypothetical protein